MPTVDAAAPAAAAPPPILPACDLIQLCPTTAGMCIARILYQVLYCAAELVQTSSCKHLVGTDACAVKAGREGVLRPVRRCFHREPRMLIIMHRLLISCIDRWHTGRSRSCLPQDQRQHGAAAGPPRLGFPGPQLERPHGEGLVNHGSVGRQGCLKSALMHLASTLFEAAGVGGARSCRFMAALSAPPACRCDTWLNPEDNTTIIGYVPRLFNITRPTIPGWVYNYSAPTAPPAANASAANRSGLSSAVAALALLAYLLLA